MPTVTWQLSIAGPADWPTADALQVDSGLDEANLAAAPLHEVQRLACMAHDEAGVLLGGAVGRTWGGAAELQQLWVAPAQRRMGLGAALVRRFEAEAVARGCSLLYLETFSFQAPALYLRLGFRVVHSNAHFPHGITKFMMERALVSAVG
jgi:ribosomal protein S18 acetylase RimI-like enzyme